MSVAVILPVLQRPERVEPLLASLAGSQADVPIWPMYVVNRDDVAQREALRLTEYDPHVMVVGPREPGDYARKVNAAMRWLYQGAGNEPDDLVDWAFIGADDLCFCHGWADRAIEAAADIFDVVGTNDLGNATVMAGVHSTHSLVRIRYLDQGTIDEKGKLLHEGYSHNWVDNEFVQTAIARGAYIHAHDSWVEHLHPHWRKGQMDATYALGLQDYAADGQLYHAREPLWLK